MFQLIFREAMKKLINVGGAFDSITNVGRDGTFELVRRTWKDWRLDIQGNLPKDLEDRGVYDIGLLPDFPYRDDGILLYNSIKNYVSKVLDIYYGSASKHIKEDSELQNWGKELGTPAGQAGAGLRGIPNNGNFDRLDQVIMVCTSLIFTCAVKHAAVNFPQYDTYGYLPTMPLRLVGDPPKDKSPRTEAQIVQCLADKSTMFLTMTLMKTLSLRSMNPLGDWEVRYQFNPQVLEVEAQWRQELDRISGDIKKRNEQRNQYYKYTYLDPKYIPNSISI